MFGRDPMNGSHFIAQTSIFLLIDATAMTLGQGHGKVIEYISPDPYILCAKYLWFSSNGFDLRGKSCCGDAAADAAAAADAVETNWKHKVIPDWGDLISDFHTKLAYNFCKKNLGVMVSKGCRLHQGKQADYFFTPKSFHTSRQ